MPDRSLKIILMRQDETSKNTVVNCLNSLCLLTIAEPFHPIVQLHNL